MAFNFLSVLNIGRPFMRPGYKITHAGGQVAQWDFQNNALAFVFGRPTVQLTCSAACVILYHVIGLCKGPIDLPS